MAKAGCTGDAVRELPALRACKKWLRKMATKNDASRKISGAENSAALRFTFKKGRSASKGRDLPAQSAAGARVHV